VKVYIYPIGVSKCHRNVTRRNLKNFFSRINFTVRTASGGFTAPKGGRLMSRKHRDPYQSVPASSATIKILCKQCKVVIEEIPLNIFKRDGYWYEYCPVCGHRPDEEDSPL
jgi:hypothetical protein